MAASAVTSATATGRRRIEAIGSTLGGAWLQSVPFQRTPRLTYAHQKYTRAHLLTAVREGVAGLRPPTTLIACRPSALTPRPPSRRWPRATANCRTEPSRPERKPADPTLGPLAGPRLVGFQGYACVSCHVWKGQALSEPDPGAVGTDLTRVAGRIRRDWFDRYLEGPARFHPGTPMPTIFTKGQPATLQSVLDGDPLKQKEALWSYFALGKDAPSPKPPPPMPVVSPVLGEPPLVAQIPVRLPEGTTVESLCILFASHDLIVYDVGAGALHSGYTAAQLLRGVQGRLRTFSVSGKPIGAGFRADPPLQLVGPGKPELPAERTFHGYDRLPDGVRIRWQARFASGVMEITETLRLVAAPRKRRLLREFRFTGVPASRSVELRCHVSQGVEITASIGEAKGATVDGVFRALLVPNSERIAAVALRYELPAPDSPPTIERTNLVEDEQDRGRAGAARLPGRRSIPGRRPYPVRTASCHRRWRSIRRTAASSSPP